MARDIGRSKITKVFLVGLFIISAVFFAISGYRAYSISSSVEEKEASLRLYKREGLGGLERKKADMERKLQAAQDSYKEIVGALSSGPKSRMPSEVGDPLRFKEELYRVQTKLKEDGSAIGFQFPAGLGFGKYEKELPTVSELPIRIKQLEIIQGVARLMLNSKIPQITAIEFKDTRDVTAGEAKDVLYKEFPLKLTFNCDNEHLINLLYDLSVSDIPFTAESITLKTYDKKVLAKGKLSVELGVNAIIFP